MNTTVLNYQNIIEPTAKKFYTVISEKTGTPEFMEYVHYEKVSEYTTTIQGVGGLAMAGFIIDGGIPVKDAPIVGFRKQYTQQQISASTEITFQTKLFAFDKDGAQPTKGQIAKISSTLAKKLTDLDKALTDTKEYFVQHFLATGANNTFTFTPIGNTGALGRTGSNLTIDGVKAWSASHLREDGGTVWSTVIVSGATTNPTLSMTAMEAAHVLHGLKKDMRGLPFMSTLDTLVVWKNTANEQLARQLLRQFDKDIQLGTFADSMKIPKPKLVTLKPFGLSTTSLAWGMFDSNFKKEAFGIQFFEALSNELAPSILQPNQSTTYTANAVFEAGWADARPWMWSTGQGS